MNENYFVDEIFNASVIDEDLTKGEYEACTFENCDFSSKSLINFKFIDCTFISCNFSSSNIGNTSFQSIVFDSCKMLGLNFEQCNPFGLSLSFKNCQLNHSSFYKVQISNTLFENSKLIEVDFSEANLSNAIFNGSDLMGAVFHESNLSNSDFRNAQNYSFDPESNKIKKAKFSRDEVVHLLDKYGITIE